LSTKMTKRELQSPDKFTTTTTSWLDWATKHPRETAIAGVVLAALLVAVGLIAGGGPSTDPKAGAALAAALELADRKVEKTPAEGSKEKTFASEDEKQKAIADAMQAVRKEHRGTTSALTATLGEADARMALGDHAAALPLYDEYLANAPKSTSTRFLAYEGKAAALKANGDVEGAMAAFDAMAAESAALKDRAALGKARLLEATGSWQKAREAYEALKKEFPDSPAARTATERIAAIDFRHPAKAATADGEAK